MDQYSGSERSPHPADATVASTRPDLHPLRDAWGCRPEDLIHAYPCDACIPGETRDAFRAISIEAPPAEVFKWLCQMKIAPYSYDWIDNGGRKSPRTLTPGADQLVVGDRLMGIFDLRAFEKDGSLTIAIRDLLPVRLLIGSFVMSYVCDTEAQDGTRLRVKLIVPKKWGFLGSLFFKAICWSDLFMMRKQLMTFKECAEAGSHTQESKAPRDERAH